MPTVFRWLLQLFISLVLLASALGKSLDLPGFVAVLKTYQVFSDPMLQPLALAVTACEFALGAWMLSGRQLVTAALVAGCLNAGYAIWMTISLLRGLDLSNCGCFGVFFPQPLRWYSPLEDLVLVAMSGVLMGLASIRPPDRRSRAFGSGAAVLLVVAMIGIGAWWHLRYAVAPDLSVPVQFLAAEAYPDAPEPRSSRFGDYRHGRLRILHIEGTRFRFILEPESAHATAVELDDVDLSHLVAAVPSWLPRDHNLITVGLIDREWNRQQVSFGRRSQHLRLHPGGDGFETRALSRVDLARNCLNAGLWELILFTTEHGEERAYEHLWFTFPLGLYKQVFERVNGLSYWDFWWSLEHWNDPAGTPIPLERLRAVVEERPVRAEVKWDEPPMWGGEQRAKRKNILTKPAATYRGWYGDPVRFASFIPPGIYSRTHPRETQLHRLSELTGAILRQVRVTDGAAPLDEIELSFIDGRTGEPSRLIIGGLALRALPRLRPTDYDKGWQAPMGIGNPGFFESYKEALMHPPRQRMFYSVLLDGRDRWLDHHAVGVDGPLLHRDAADPGRIHLYLLSYERHALLTHVVITCPDGNRGRPGC